MAGSHIVLLTNIMIAVAFASAFAGIHFYDRRQEAARWFALAYGAGALEASLYFVHIATGLIFFRTLGTFALAGLLTSLVFGVCTLYRRPAPMGIVVGLAGTVGVLGVWSTLLDQTMLVRYAIYPIPMGLMMAVAATMVWRSDARRRTDRVLIALLSLNTLQFLARPIFFLLLVHGLVAPGDIPNSAFAVGVHAGVSFGAVSTGLCLLSIISLRIKEDVDDLAVRDCLSGILNRRGFEEQAGAAMPAARRGGKLALILVDIDRFKSINDRHGHAFGDEVIAAMGALLAAHASGKDVAGRIGGEEFALLLADADAEKALAIAERLRERFSARCFHIGEEEARFTASFGVTAIEAGDTLSDALRRADAALYDAKDAGRDRIAKSAVKPRLAAA